MVGVETAVIPPAGRLGDEFRLTQVIQRPLYGASGHQFPGDRLASQPAGAALACVVLQVHIDRPGTLGQLGQVDILKTAHTAASLAQELDDGHYGQLSGAPCGKQRQNIEGGHGRKLVSGSPGP